MSTIASQVAAAAARSIARAAGAGQRSMSTTAKPPQILGSTIAKQPQILGYVDATIAHGMPGTMMTKHNLVQNGPFAYVESLKGPEGKNFMSKIWTHKKTEGPPPDTTCPENACKLVNVYYPAHNNIGGEYNYSFWGKVYRCKF